MASRKVRMSKWKEGQRRRSPRISAISNACKSKNNKSKSKSMARQSRRVGRTALAPPAQETSLRKPQAQAQGQGPASRTRARGKRKLKPLHDVAATSLSSFATQQPNDMQGSDQQSHDKDHPISSDPPTAPGGNSTKFDDKAASPDQLSSVRSSKWIPEKRTLELILDILQRRDTNEIFAEPVDPEEVEDYYEIIKEPMDFGTMRAKLHEGMYTSLQQFEYDVYLISRNAMHFNSSATIYFREARAINELARKVFHALKTDPENFELEFSETRRRTSRRLITESRAPSYSSNCKPATNLGPSSKSNISSKIMPCSLHNSSNLRKSISGIHGHSAAATEFSARDNEVHSGAINGRRNSFAEVDRRCTYRPWMSLLTENDSIVYSDSEQLIPVNQQDIGYRDSLMLFVKDLGPVAQKIAKRKLIGCSIDASNHWPPDSKHWFQELECQNPKAFGSTQRGLATLDSAYIAAPGNLLDHFHRGPNIFGNANYKVNSSYAAAGEKAYAMDQMLTRNASADIPSSEEKRTPVPFRGDDRSSSATDVFGHFGFDRFHQDNCSEIQLGFSPFSFGAQQSNLSVAGSKNSGKSSTPITVVGSNSYTQAPQLQSYSAQSQANMWDLRSRNNYNVPALWPQQAMGSSICSEAKGSSGHNDNIPIPRSWGQDITAVDEVETSGSVEASQPMRLNSQFIFDLPFLKKRLDQINASGKDKDFQQGSGAEDPLLDKVNWKRESIYSQHKELSIQTYNDSYKPLSLDAQHGDLALQL